MLLIGGQGALNQHKMGSLKTFRTST